MRILIMGLPGSGKTTLAKVLKERLENCSWYNADEIRKIYNDWDFSPEGRLRQAKRMFDFSTLDIEDGQQYVICDFVAPTKEIRNVFDADFTIWMDTINQGRFEDTNKLFENPTSVNLVINDFKYDIDYIVYRIVNYEQS